MDRLSGLDASFLYLETPAQLMHVCGVIVLDPSTMPGGYSFDAIRDEIDSRVRDVPEFTRRLRKVPLGLDHPIWVHDKHFDIDRHVHRLALPAPGGYARADRADRPPRRAAAGPLAAAVGDVGDRGVRGRQGRRLLEDAPRHRRRRLRLEPDLAPVQPRGRRAADRGGRSRRGTAASRGRRELFGRGVASIVTRPLNAVRLVTPSAQLITKTVGRARAGTAMAAPFSAPRTSFNGTITGQPRDRAGRHGHRGHPADQERHRHHRQRRRPGDRRRRAALLPAGPRRAARRARCWRPCRCRCASRRSGPPGANKVSALFAKLGTDTEDPLERLRDLAERNKNAKEHHQAISADSLQDWAEFAAPRTFGLAVRTYAGLRLRREAPGRAQPGHLQRARPAGAAVLHGRRDPRPSTRSARSSTAPA